ncbi:MAG: aldo/keto reductase [Pirellulales bacterium]
MITRRFGHTELEMPVFSCGGMRYQHKWQDVPLQEVPPENQANLEATIRQALELGINHIETARGYGSSERQLGSVLPGIPRESLIVQTKISPLADSEVFVRQFHESLDRLQLDYVDLLGIHGINTYESLWWTVKPGGCLEAARRLVDAGKIRHVGFSTHAPLDVILAAINCSQGESSQNGGFDYVNLHWYYINQQNEAALEAATERDMGIFIISPADKGGMLYDPPAKLVELCAPLHPLVFNCLFCLSRPEIHTLSLGAARPSDFDLQLSSLPLLAEANQLLPPVLNRLREALHDAVGEDWANRMDTDLPPWEETPGHMNLPVILWLRNLMLAYDMTEYGKMRYNLLGNGGHWFPGLNASQADQLDLSTALKDSPFAEKIPTWLHETHSRLYQAPKQRLSQST